VPTEPLFISSTRMTEMFKKIMGKPKLGAKQVNHIIQEHAGAGRLKEFEYKRTATSNGYEVGAEAIRKYLEAYEQKLKENENLRSSPPPAAESEGTLL